MRVFGLAAAVAIAMGGSVQADDLSALRQGLDKAALANMTLTYVCREAFGGLTRYQAARATAVDAFVLAGMKTNEATLAVDHMDQRLKADPRVKSSQVSKQICVEKATNAESDVEAWEAKLRAAKAGQ